MAKMDIIKAEIQVANRENKIREIELQRMELSEKEERAKLELVEWKQKLEEAKKLG